MTKDIHTQSHAKHISAPNLTHDVADWYIRNTFLLTNQSSYPDAIPYGWISPQLYNSDFFDLEIIHRFVSANKVASQ